MPGIDRIRPEQPEEPDRATPRPERPHRSWAERQQASDEARDFLKFLREQEQADDASEVKAASETDQPATEPERSREARPAVERGAHPGQSNADVPSAALDRAPDSGGGQRGGRLTQDRLVDEVRPTEHRRETTAPETRHTRHEDPDPPAATDTPIRSASATEATNTPWEQRLDAIRGPSRIVEPNDPERVQVQRLEHRPDATAQHRSGDPNIGHTARQTSFHATTVGGTDATAGTEAPGRHAGQDSPRPWWVDTGDPPAQPVTEPPLANPRPARESTPVGSEPAGTEHPATEDNAPMSWVSDRFGIPGGVPVAKGWSAFPTGDSAAGRAADASPAQDDFGPIDGERWRQVPCAEQRPQRVYELHKSDMPLTEAESDAIVRAKDKIADVLGEASGRELTADDVQEALQYVNPTGGGDNCVECSKAVDDILRGHPAAAGPTVDQRPYYVEAAVSARAIDYVEDISAVNIERQMLDAGPGARGIVIGWKHHSPAHAYNVANIDGELYWLDGQKDLMTEHDPHGSRSFDLYRTG